MQYFQMITEQVSILFLLMAAGWILLRLKIISEGFIKSLTDVVFFVAMPALVVVSFQIDYSIDTANELLFIAIASFLMHIGTLLLGGFLYRKKEPGMRAVLWSDLVFTNSVFMGYPILLAMYGTVGLLYASVNAVFFQFFMWGTAPIIFGGQLDRRSMGRNLVKALRHPGVVCTVFGVVLFLTGWRLPVIVQRPLEMLGNMAVPSSMILVGAKLGQAKWRELMIPKEMLGNAMLRLIVLPLAILGLCYICGMRGAPLGVMLIVAATPMATSMVLFAERFGANTLYASQLVVFTTAVSVITLPCMMLLLHML